MLLCPQLWNPLQVGAVPGWMLIPLQRYSMTCAMPPTPDFAGTRHWRPFLAPGSAANNVLSPREARGLILSSWGPFWDHFGFLGHGPLFEYLTHFEILKIQFFSTSPRDYAHWNCAAILDLGVASVQKVILRLSRYGDFDVSGPEHIFETQRICC